MRIPAWKKSFELVEAILEKEILPATIPEIPTVRRMTLGMNSSLVVPSLFARAAAERQQRKFTDGWNPLFIGYTAAVYFHTCDIKINSWTTQAKKMRGSMPPKFGEYVTGVGRWQDDYRRRSRCAKRRNEVRHKKIPGTFWVGTGEVETGGEGAGCGRPVVCGSDGVQENGSSDTITPVSGHPWRQKKRPVEDRFKRILERRRAESEEESMDKTLSEAGEEMEVGNSPEPKPAEEYFSAQELLKDLSGHDWADTATPPLTSSPRKNLELPLTSETSNMGMIILYAQESEKNTFGGNKTMFLETLDGKAWQEFLREFNRETNSEITLENFKEELWNTVVKFGKPVLMATGLDEKTRRELLSKMVELSEAQPKTKDDE